jgi:uncharacterized protein (TIGR02145 family)
MKHLVILIALAATLATTAQDCTAPEADGITYGVTLINGQCWTTQNLGATAPAPKYAAKADRYAGNYYTFNSATPTDGSNWIPWRYEDTDWQPENDPCAALGTGWHIPTRTEWRALDEGNRWGVGANAYRDINLHAAGKRYFSTGNLINRGTEGIYWSASQLDGENAWVLYTSVGAAVVTWAPKTYGLPVRCVK